MGRPFMAFIATIDYQHATGRLRGIYDELIASRGRLADVHMIQSLNPETIVSHMNLYMDIMFGPSPLKRWQREMIGVVVSAANACDYCTLHHREALLHFWKDEKRTDALIADPGSASLSENDLALCLFARSLTVSPEQLNETQIESLKSRGFEDRAILDATLVVAYFNFVNRIVLGLGLGVREDEVAGYKYE